MNLQLTEQDVTSFTAMSIGTSLSTYISATGSAVQDMNANPLNSVVASSPLRVAYFTDSPILISFEYPFYYFYESDQPATIRLFLNATATQELSFDVQTMDGFGATGIKAIACVKLSSLQKLTLHGGTYIIM